VSDIPSNMDCSPVISLIIVESTALSGDRVADTGRVLVCVRDPATNAHHPSVLSVPTQRIPAALLQSIKRQCRLSHLGENSTALEANWVDSRQATGHDLVVYSVESVLSQKLGISEGECGAGGCLFRAKPVWIERGYAAYAKGNGLEIEHEPIEMLGVLVVVSDPAAFPASTHSYSPILWTPISQFLLSYEQKNVECIDPTLNAVELCIHGVCVTTAYEYLKRHVAPRSASANKDGHLLTT
jgi:hypothetical protein